MNKIIFTVDLGHFKAYRMFKNPMESTRLELIKSFDSLEAHEKLSDSLTDQAGRFGLSGGKMGVKGNGEAHSINIENSKRMTKRIAGNITAIVKTEDCEVWCLAAPKAVNNQILDNLEKSVRDRLHKNVSADLTKMSKAEVLRYFA